MLRVKSDSECSLVMQRRERLFTPLFIRAFLIAFFIHFLGLLSLKLEKDKLPTALWVFPFADVQADIGDVELSHPTNPSLKSLGNKMLPPPRSEPLIPNFHHQPRQFSEKPPSNSTLPATGKITLPPPQFEES